jgi:hypothetical protein
MDRQRRDAFAALGARLEQEVDGAIGLVAPHSVVAKLADARTMMPTTASTNWLQSRESESESALR